VTELERRTHRAVARTLERADDRVTTLRSRARIHDPAAALSRGWSITRNAAGDVVRDPSAVSAGDELVTQLHRGAVRSTVTANASTSNDNPTEHEEGTTT
jgi:exodeoxyribonuclease VII large subunit